MEFSSRLARGFCILAVLLHGYALAPAAVNGLSDQDMENLRSLPYAASTEEKVHEKESAVRMHDRQRANPGYTLVPDQRNCGYMIDMDGRVVHEWTFGPPSLNLVYFVIDAKGNAYGVCAHQGLIKVDKDSRRVWMYKTQAHHDVEILPDGSLIVPSYGQDRLYHGRTVNNPTLDFITPDGRRTLRWRVWDAEADLRPLHPSSPLDRPGKSANIYDYYHLNSVKALPKTKLSGDPRFREGNLLVSFRNISLIVILDKETRKPVWSWGPGEIHRQHAPYMLSNGNILLFDNGRGDLGSRAVELDPVTKKIVWQYPNPAGTFFYANWGSNAQRLPNGNTMIVQADRGRIFEVTKAGDMVWEFFIPFAKWRKRLPVYRSIRVTDIDPAGFAKGDLRPIESVESLK